MPEPFVPIDVDRVERRWWGFVLWLAPGQLTPRIDIVMPGWQTWAKAALDYLRGPK